MNVELLMNYQEHCYLVEGKMREEYNNNKLNPRKNPYAKCLKENGCDMVGDEIKFDGEELPENKDFASSKTVVINIKDQQ